MTINGKTAVFLISNREKRENLQALAKRRGARVFDYVSDSRQYIVVSSFPLSASGPWARNNPNALILTERQFLRAARGPIRRAIEQAIIGAAMGAILGAALFAGFLL